MEKIDEFYINPVQYTNAPAPENRTETEMKTYEILSQLSIPFTRIDHSPTATIEACHDIDKILGVEICKNLFLCNTQKTNFYMLMIPGSKVFRTAVLSKQIGSARLSFAPAEYMEKFLKITPGSVSVLGLMNDTRKQVQLLIDRDILEKHTFIGCHPCMNTTSLKIRISDILEKFLPYTGHDYTPVDLPFSAGL